MEVWSDGGSEEMSGGHQKCHDRSLGSLDVSILTLVAGICCCVPKHWTLITNQLIECGCGTRLIFMF